MDRKISLEKVIWVDPHSVDEWTDVSELELDALHVLSVGFILKENENAIALSSVFDPPVDKSCCIMIIPKICILSREVYDAQYKTS